MILKDDRMIPGSTLMVMFGPEFKMEVWISRRDAMDAAVWISNDDRRQRTKRIDHNNTRLQYSYLEGEHI